ncbi:MAG: type I DNA topoisomerase [Planctomycetota bacterium]
MAKKKSTKKKTAKKAGAKKAGVKKKASSFKRPAFSAKDVEGKHLVIVESPTKARTINRYLGPDYHVMASVGHVRDLPRSAPKGAKRADHPVPGVNLDKDFEPTYEVLPDSKRTVTDLRKAAKAAADIWFATDLDREGEAIAWHLAHALDIPIDNAKRVVFNAITKDEIARAFGQPRPIETERVDAQQARRILDRIVGYQVSPLLWKKVAGGLSAGRVQSVATRLVVEREREIKAFIPDEYWKITALLTPEPGKAAELGEAWRTWAKVADPEAAPPTIKDQNAWLSDQGCVRAELTHVAGKKFEALQRDDAQAVAESLGFALENAIETEDPKGKGPAKNVFTLVGGVASDRPSYTVKSIETKRTRSRPSPPFITSTLQQQASTRLGFNLKRTMRVAQQLYEGIDLKGSRGQTGLITYMRTDSTHLSSEAVGAVRGWVGKELGDKYLPEKPTYFKSSNKDAQEAHEAIRPTDVSITPSSIQGALTDEQFRLYDLVWRRFVSCQMTPAEFDATAVTVETPTTKGAATWRATGRVLVFDGHLRIMGMPKSDDALLPKLEEGQDVAPIHLDPSQHFTSPPPRYTEASLQKKLEEEGIGRPSTYASIIGTIQDRKYVEQVTPRDKRLRATDLGVVVTDKLLEAFPEIMEVGYTRRMEAELDDIEGRRKNWRELLHEFYGPFKAKLEQAHESMTHAKAEFEPAPHTCPTCGASTVYRFGKNGKFLSCSTYPDCKYAAPIDQEGNPLEPELTDIICPEDGQRMVRKTGRFGPFLSSQNYPEVKFIAKLDPKTGGVKLPTPEPMPSDVVCPKCGDETGATLLVRDSKRGLWLSCSRFPKCRGRVGFSKLEEDKQAEIETKWKQWLKDHPVPELRTSDGVVLTEDGYLPVIAGEEPAGAIQGDDDLGSGSDAA